MVIQNARLVDDVRKWRDPGLERCKLQVMYLDKDACYRALSTRHARFDGRFFVAVKTTRVYCRPMPAADVGLFRAISTPKKRATASDLIARAEAWRLGALMQPSI